MKKNRGTPLKRRNPSPIPYNQSKKPKIFKAKKSSIKRRRCSSKSTVCSSVPVLCKSSIFHPTTLQQLPPLDGLETMAKLDKQLSTFPTINHYCNVENSLETLVQERRGDLIFQPEDKANWDRKHLSYMTLWNVHINSHSRPLNTVFGGLFIGVWTFVQKFGTTIRNHKLDLLFFTQLNTFVDQHLLSEGQMSDLLTFYHTSRTSPSLQNIL